MKPFVESSQFEQGNFSDSFFATGSQDSLGEIPGTFTRSLMSKEQIRVSFSVQTKAQMLPNSSSIYYFNRSNKVWNIPANSVKDHVGPFNKYSYRTTGWTPASGTIAPYYSTYGTTVTEDAKCFDAYGRLVASGSLEIFRPTLGEKNPLLPSNRIIANQTIDLLGGEAPKSNALVNYLLEDYSKSVQRAEIYDASSDELIDFEIQYPFLLEKAVFEIPVAAGSTWLGDRTITSLAIGSGTYSSTQTMPNSFYIDSGGPCVTLSLFSQKKYGTKLIRDLVLSGTITSNQDTLSSFIPRNFGARAEGNVPVVMLEPSGIPNPSGIITGTSTFTGSVIIRTRPEISNGVNGVTSGLFIVANLSSLPPLPPELASVAFTVQDFLTHVERLMSKKSVRLKEILGLPVNLLTSEFFTVTSLDAFGRGMTGFSPSGGSIFGGEYTTPQRDLQSEYNRNEFTQNPLYTPDQSVITNTIQQLSSTLDTAYKSVSPASTGAYVQLMYQTNFFGSIKPSPYLINPGDKFILAMSKTRPAISASGHNVPNPAAVDTGFQTLTRQINITGSLSGHDFCLNTGSINITLYGSYVRAGNSYTP